MYMKLVIYNYYNLILSHVYDNGKSFVLVILGYFSTSILNGKDE
jgi:hypothetical protein